MSVTGLPFSYQNSLNECFSFARSLLALCTSPVHNSILRRFTQKKAVNATAGRCLWFLQPSEFTVNHFC